MWQSPAIWRQSAALYMERPRRKQVYQKGYVIPVTGKIMMTFQGQTSPYDLDMDIICYEKDGEWYLGEQL